MKKERGESSIPSGVTVLSSDRTENVNPILYLVSKQWIQTIIFKFRWTVHFWCCTYSQKFDWFHQWNHHWVWITQFLPNHISPVTIVYWVDNFPFWAKILTDISATNYHFWKFISYPKSGSVLLVFSFVFIFLITVISWENANKQKAKYEKGKISVTGELNIKMGNIIVKKVGFRLS